MKHRPWWKPGSGEGSWRPNEPKPDPNLTVLPAPAPDEVVLVRQSNGTVQAVYRRFIRE